MNHRERVLKLKPAPHEVLDKTPVELPEEMTPPEVFEERMKRYIRQLVAQIPSRDGVEEVSFEDEDDFEILDDEADLDLLSADDVKLMQEELELAQAAAAEPAAAAEGAPPVEEAPQPEPTTKE